ncbi:MAG: hypothetical protein H6Q00_3011 [Holophagaceae bacterium]|nr:hypothetical protein [Holophagaceae bacterium]
MASNCIRHAALALSSLLLTGALSQAQAAPRKITEVQLSHGSVSIHDYGTLKLHAYHTGDPLGDECYVLETKSSLIAIESPAFEANLQDWKLYTEGLKKPLKDVLLAAHPTGGQWYGKAKSHATPSAKAAISEGDTKKLVGSLKQAFGPSFLDELPPIDVTHPEGPVTLDGVKFVFTNVGPTYNIEIPALRAVYTHMLGADCHSILPSPAIADGTIAMLRGFQKNRYEVILSGHHRPEGQREVATKIAYIEKAKALAAQSKSKDEFLGLMKAAFPGYAGQNYLDMTASFLFQ